MFLSWNICFVFLLLILIVERGAWCEATISWLWMKVWDHISPGGLSSLPAFPFSIPKVCSALLFPCGRTWVFLRKLAQLLVVLSDSRGQEEILSFLLYLPPLKKKC